MNFKNKKIINYNINSLNNVLTVLVDNIDQVLIKCFIHFYAKYQKFNMSYL